MAHRTRMHDGLDVGARLAEAKPVLSDVRLEALGPHTLVWKFYGDLRMSMMFQRAAGTQNCIAQLAQGVEDHSVLFSDFKGRGERTVPPIMKTIYSDDQDVWGRTVRDYHKPIKGTMADGSRYHAMNPELFYWAHATFVESLIYGTDTFIRRLSYEEKAQIFEEGKLWYSKYGVSDRAQPQTYDEFLRYWDSMLLRFESNRTIRYGTGYLRQGIPRPRQVNKVVWKVVERPLNSFVSTLIGGTIPQEMRDVAGLTWNAKLEKRYQRYAKVIRALNPLFNRLPMKWLYMSWARDAFEREGVDPRKRYNRMTPPANPLSRTLGWRAMR